MNKVCYLNLVTYLKTGGIENYNKSFLKVLDNLEIKTTCVSVYDKANKEEFKNIKFKNFNKNKIKALLYVLKNICNIDKLIVAHINLLPIAILVKLIKPKLRIFISIYGIDAWLKLPYIYRIFLKYVNIISISSYTTQEFCKYNGFGYKVDYLPPYTATNRYYNNKNFYNKMNFNILSVSRLDTNDNYKGIDSIIKIIPLLIKIIPNLQYTIIGKGEDKRRLENLAKDLKVQQYVEFKGFAEKIEPYYQYCDIFVLPSKGEGFGIVYLEAMKYKKSCIACDLGGQTDVVIDNKTGYLCEYNNLKCLSNKIIDLYQNPEKRKLFGENGYRHLIDNFTFDKFKNRLKDILYE